MAGQVPRHTDPPGGGNDEYLHHVEEMAAEIGVVRGPNAQGSPAKEVVGRTESGQKHSHSGQRKRYKDTLKVCPTCCGINLDTREEAARNCKIWRSLTNSRASTCEDRKISRSLQKRRLRKCKPSTQLLSVRPAPGPPLSTLHCVFAVRIGLIGHLRTLNDLRQQQ